MDEKAICKLTLLCILCLEVYVHVCVYVMYRGLSDTHLRFGPFYVPLHFLSHKLANGASKERERKTRRDSRHNLQRLHSQSNTCTYQRHSLRKQNGENCLTSFVSTGSTTTRKVAKTTIVISYRSTCFMFQVNGKKGDKTLCPICS